MVPSATGPYRDIRANMEQTWRRSFAEAADTVRNCRCWRRCKAEAVGAENGVTAADLVFAVVRGFTRFRIWLREHARLGHCQYSFHYDSGI